MKLALIAIGLLATTGVVYAAQDLAPYPRLCVADFVKEITLLRAVRL